MKWILLIVPLIIKQLAHSGSDDKNPIEEIKQLLKENSFKILIILSAFYAITSLFISGILLVVLNFAAQFDSGVKPKFSAIAASGFIMIMFSLVVFSIAIYYSKANERKTSPPKLKRQEHPLESALTLLVNDFVQEREFKRNISKNDSEKDISKEESFKTNETFERH